MSTPEKNLSKLLKLNLPKKTHFQRIENRVSSGTPDCYLCHNGLSVFVELKTTKNNRVSMRPSQIAWNLSHSRAKGLSFILVKHLLTSNLFLFDGCQAMDVSDEGLLVQSLYEGKNFDEILYHILRLAPNK